MNRQEAALLVPIAVCAWGSRLAMVTAFPTQPVSDFLGLVRFAVAFKETGFATGNGSWQFYGVGLPFLLSAILRIVPGEPAVVARYATAVLTGAVALVPFFVCRSALGLPARLAASLLLALWPGHVVFSGVVAQDNWILFPSVLLACLAVRTLRTGRAAPLTSGVTLGLATAVRQEMLVVLLPLALAAAGILPRSRSGRPWNAFRWAVALGLALVVAATLRWAGTGHFRLNTEHGGLAALGALTPGAGPSYWAFPQTYFAAELPELAGDWEGMKRESLRLALREAARRPFFQSVRAFDATVNSLLRSEAVCLRWSLGPDVLPATLRPRADALLNRASMPIWVATFVVLTLGLASVLLALRHGPEGITLLALAAALKLAVHGLIAAQPRYFVVVTAFALLACVLAAEHAARHGLGLAALSSLLHAAGLMLAVVLSATWAHQYVLRHEEQLTYRFTLRSPEGRGQLRCIVRRGLLSYLRAPTEAAIRPLRPDPAPGDEAAAECEFIGSGEGGSPVSLEFRDAYSPGGYPHRIHQVVTIDGRDAERHDLAAHPGEAWVAVPIGPAGRAATHRVALRVIAVGPDPGLAWGLAANTSFRLADR